MNLNQHPQKFSPTKYARIGGAIYLMIIATGIFGELVVRNKLVVPGDAASTASNLLASPLLWRLGISGDLVMHLCDIPLMVIFYLLLKPVNKNLALLNLLFNIVQTAVLTINLLNFLMPLFLLGNSTYLAGADMHSLQSMAYAFIKLNSYGFGIGLVFFGFVCLIEGYLIFTSGLLPKAIGLLMQLAGVCYLINSFTLILQPDLARALFPFILMPCFLAESSFALWLLIKGVNVSVWNQWSEASTR